MKTSDEPFTLPGSAGEPIRGHVHRPLETRGAALPVVVICHGFKGFMDWGFFPFLADSLAAAGRACVRFNFSHGGIGERPLEFDRLDLFERNTLSRELFDLNTLAEAIRTRRYPWTRDLDGQRMALVGHSRGGGVAILHAAHHPIWRGVATLAAIAETDRLSAEQKEVLEREGRLLIRNARTGQDMPIGRCLEEDRRANAAALDIPAAAARLECPLLLIHGVADESVPNREPEILRRACPHAEMRWIMGADHVFGAGHPFTGESPMLMHAIHFIDNFLTRNLRALVS